MIAERVGSRVFSHGTARRAILVGWAIGSLFAIGAFLAWFRYGTPLYLVGAGGSIAAGIAASFSEYSFGDGAVIGVTAAGYAGVTFTLFYMIHYFVLYYLGTGYLFFLSSSTVAPLVTLPVFLVYLLTGGATGWAVFAVKG